MGNSAMELVLSQQVPVDPDGSQPPYYRSKRSVQTSSDLISFQQCMAGELKGQGFDNREDVKDAFSSAASSCS